MSSEDPSAPPLPEQRPSVTIDTANNVTPLIQIVNWVLLSISTFAIVVRLLIKYNMVKTLNVDDGLFIGVLILTVSQTAAVFVACQQGFGQHLSALNSGQIQGALKGQYASEILFIACICCIKLAYARSVSQLTPRKQDRKFCLYLGIFSLVWCLASVFVVSFECKTPSTWDYLNGQCINRTQFWNSFAVLNIITDVLLIAMPISIVLRIQTSLQRRIQVCMYFVFRVIVIASTAVQTYYLNRTFPISFPAALSLPSTRTDITFTQWPYLLTTQLVITTSIISACVPQFKQLFIALESGMIRNDDLRRRGQVGEYGYTGAKSNLGGVFSGASGNTPTANINSNAGSKGSGNKSMNDKSWFNFSTNASVNKSVIRGDDEFELVGSPNRREKFDGKGIVRETQVEVCVEEREGAADMGKTEDGSRGSSEIGSQRRI